MARRLSLPHKPLIRQLVISIDGKILSFLEIYRRQLLDAAGLMFLFGVIVGFLSPLYSITERLVFLYLFATVVPSLLFEIAIDLSSAILCLICYWNLKRERLKLVSIRGTVAAGLFILTGAWLTGLLVFGAALISSLCQTR